VDDQLDEVLVGHHDPLAWEHSGLLETGCEDRPLHGLARFRQRHPCGPGARQPVL
jgi:hypothetical protein